MFKIIESAESSGVNIWSVVSDMGSKNQGLWKELGVGKVVKGEIQKTSFQNPFDKTRNIYVFPDFPHLLKLLRNHLIDSKLTLPDGVVLDKSIIQDLLEVQKSDLKLTFNLTQKHINVRGQQRMKVRPAFELFSAKVSKAILVAFPKRKSEAEFFNLINNFSDIMNSRTNPDQYSSIFKNPYGSRYEEQNEFLSKFYHYFKNIRVGNRCQGSYPPFQKGFLIAIHSLLGLYQEMASRVHAKYIMTSRLNQDFVENSFGIIRGAGGFNMKPDQVQCINRVKRIIVGKRFNKSMATNTQSCEDQTFLSSASLKCLVSAPKDMNSLNFQFPDSIQEEIDEIDTSVHIKDVNFNDLSLYGRCEEGGREYVAGFIAKKLLDQYPELARKPSQFSPDNALWIRLLSEGGLKEPSTMWFSYFRKFEEFFEAIHPYGKVNKEYSIIARLVQLLTKNYPSVPVKVIQLYATTRTSIRIATINKAVESRKFLLQERRRNMNNEPEPEQVVEQTENLELDIFEEVQNVGVEGNLEELLDLLDGL